MSENGIGDLLDIADMLDIVTWFQSKPNPSRYTAIRLYVAYITYFINHSVGAHICDKKNLWKVVF